MMKICASLVIALAFSVLPAFAEASTEENMPAITERVDADKNIGVRLNSDWCPEGAICQTSDEDSSGVYGLRNTLLRLLGGILSVAAIVAVIVIVVSGIRMIAASGDEEALGKAKNMLLWAVVGLVLIISSLMLVRFVVEIIYETSGQVKARLGDITVSEGEAPGNALLCKPFSMELTQAGQDIRKGACYTPESKGGVRVLTKECKQIFGEDIQNICRDLNIEKEECSIAAIQGFLVGFSEVGTKGYYHEAGDSSTPLKPSLSAEKEVDGWYGDRTTTAIENYFAASCTAATGGVGVDSGAVNSRGEGIRRGGFAGEETGTDFSESINNLDGAAGNAGSGSAADGAAGAGGAADPTAGSGSAMDLAGLLAGGLAISGAFGEDDNSNQTPASNNGSLNNTIEYEGSTASDGSEEELTGEGTDDEGDTTDDENTDDENTDDSTDEGNTTDEADSQNTSNDDDSSNSSSSTSTEDFNATPYTPNSGTYGSAEIPTSYSPNEADGSNGDGSNGTTSTLPSQDYPYSFPTNTNQNGTEPNPWQPGNNTNQKNPWGTNTTLSQLNGNTVVPGLYTPTSADLLNSQFNYGFNPLQKKGNENAGEELPLVGPPMAGAAVLAVVFAYVFRRKKH